MSERCVEWQSRSACGNYVRVRWTPEGLQADTGQGWAVLEGPIARSAEYVPSWEQPRQVERPAPPWWGEPR